LRVVFLGETDRRVTPPTYEAIARAVADDVERLRHGEPLRNRPV